MGQCLDTDQEINFQAVNDASREELRAVFMEFDVDGDNFIEEHEMLSVMARMGHAPAKDELHAMFLSADINGDGKIDFEEFVRIARANPLSLSLKAVFKELDADGDGTISPAEMRRAFNKMGHKLSRDEIDAIFKQCDVNNDGKINYDEFVSLMCRKQKPTRSKSKRHSVKSSS